LVNIKDIAKAANVSAATVSNVIHGKVNVGDETREKVLALCKQMNYRPNISARNLKTGKTDTVMFVFSDFQRGFYLHIINGINDYLLENGLSMIVCTHTSLRNFLHTGFVDGAIVLDAHLQDADLLSVAGPSLPLVMMDRVLDSPYISSVVTDNNSSMEPLVRRLTERGYRSFCYVGGIAHTRDHMERYECFRRVLAEQRIPFSNEQYYQGDYSIDSGTRVGSILAVGGNLPEAVVCANDHMAAGLVSAMEERGINVPAQLAVTGFDGETIPALSKGFLTTAVIPRYEMGYLAAETLVAMMRKKSGREVRRIAAPQRIGVSD